MARTPTGSFGTHITEEVTTTCRLLQITRSDGEIVRYTDHDEDIVLVSEATPATGLFTQTPTAGGPEKAEGIFAITAEQNAANGETVTIGSTVYTFVTALSAGPTVPYEVLIGADLLESLENLNAAINGGAGEGTLYSVDTDPHPDVDAELIDITNPQIITLSSGGGGGSDDQLVSDSGPGVTRIGNCSPLSRAFDGDEDTFAETDSRKDSQAGLYVGLSFTTPRYITRARIRQGKYTNFGYERYSTVGNNTPSSVRNAMIDDYNDAKG